MRWRRPWWFYNTDPLPPVTRYVNIVGDKLRMLLRAPSGIEANLLGARRWTDEISLTQLVSDQATSPTLTADGTNFRGMKVARMPTASRFVSPAFQNALVYPGDTPELFALVRAVTLPSNLVAFGLYTPSLSIVTSLEFGVGTANYNLAGSVLPTAYVDTTSPHLITMRSVSGTMITSIDGVDVASLGGLHVASQSATLAMVGLAGGFTFDGFIGMCGFLSSAMSTAERAAFLALARTEYGF